MGNFSLILGLFCTFCWASMSVFEFHTLVVQPNEEVTLWCSNLSGFPAHIFWFKLVDGSNESCISSMFSSDSDALLRKGFRSGKFTATSNSTNLFLTIKWVDSSDSGLYTCGKSNYLKKEIFTATFLQVEDVFVPFWILCAASIFLLIVIICLVAKISRIRKAQADSQNPQQNKNPEPDIPNYAALSFYPKAKRNRMAEKELEATVVYAATR